MMLAMIQIKRVGTHRHVIDGARKFRVNKATGELVVWWSDGTSSTHERPAYEFVDARRRGITDPPTLTAHVTPQSEPLSSE